MTNKFINYILGSVLKDLGFPDTLWPIVLSEEEGIEKTSPGIFMKALEFVNREEALKHDPIQPQECLHVGDELVWSVLVLYLTHKQNTK